MKGMRLAKGNLSPTQSSGRGPEGTNNLVCEMDEQMSWGPDQSYSEGEETGQGENMSQSPTRSSGRVLRGETSCFEMHLLPPLTFTTMRET